MSGSSTMGTSETKLEALKIQSSAYGVVIPVVGGVNRIAGNLIDYLGFKATPITSTQGSGGKGGSVKTQSTTYSYSASVLMGICQGPIGGLGRIWKGKDVLSGGWSGAAVAAATQVYTPPASGAMTVTLANGATIIGSPTISAVIEDGSWSQEDTVWTSYTYEVQLAAGADFSVSGSVVTVLDARWRSIALTIRYQYGSGSINLTPLTTLGLTLAAGDLSQTAPAWIAGIDSAHSLAYTGLAFVHGQDYPLGSGATVDNHSFEVQGSGAYRYSATKPDCNPAEFAADLLTNGRYGARMPSSQLEVRSWIDYCAAAGLLMSPLMTEQQRAADFVDAICKLTNSAAVWSTDRLKFVPYGDVSVTANGVTWTPNTTPAYDLDDDRWYQDGTEDPIQWTDKPGADRYNVVNIEYCDRSMYYAKTIASASDDADIAATGRRVMPTVSAPWICDAVVARLVAQILLQRSLLVARTATIKLPWAYCLLEPMDLITVSDTLLGDSKMPVRITAIDEDEEGTLTIDIEDWPLGAASPTAYTSQVPGGYLQDYRAAPGSVQTPVFFEAPIQLTGTGLEVYAAVKGSGANWGGCRVWVSLDGATYKNAGIVYGQSRYGALSAAAAANASSIALSGLGSAQLLNASAADAAALTSLVYVGGVNPEYLAYTTATLTGAGAYTLTGLVHGAYGSIALAHSAGDAFVRVDDAIAKSGDLTLDYIGKTIYFKFTSFNIFQGAEESLASVTAYSYMVLGTMAKLPSQNVSGATATVVAGAAAFSWTACTDPDYGETEVRIGASWAAATFYGRVKGTRLAWLPYPAEGSYTVWFAHRDTLGNYSAAPQSIAVAVSSVGAIFVGGNVLPNADFTGYSGATALPDGWVPYTNGVSTSPAWSRQATGSIDNGAWVYLSAGTLLGSSIDRVGIATAGNQPFPMPNGGPVVISGHVIHANTSTGVFFGEYKNTAGSIIGTFTKTLPAGASTWRRYEFFDTAPVGTASLFFYVWFQGLGTSSTLNAGVDKLSVSPGDSSLPFAPKAGEIYPGQVGTTELADFAATALASGLKSAETIVQGYTIAGWGSWMTTSFGSASVAQSGYTIVETVTATADSNGRFRVTFDFQMALTNNGSSADQIGMTTAIFVNGVAPTAGGAFNSLNEPNCVPGQTVSGTASRSVEFSTTPGTSYSVTLCAQKFALNNVSPISGSIGTTWVLERIKK
jgi:hypothetical protein